MFCYGLVIGLQALWKRAVACEAYNRVWSVVTSIGVAAIILAGAGCAKATPTRVRLVTLAASPTSKGVPAPSLATSLLLESATPTEPIPALAKGAPTASSSARPTASSTPQATARPTPTRRPTESGTAQGGLPTASRTPSASLPQDIVSETVQTADGIALATTLYRPSGSSPFPGAVLAHMGGGHQADWGDLGKQLQQAGFAVLTFDFRGHGRSGGALDPPNAATDLRAALAALRSNPDVDGGRIGLVGASMGGMASVIVAASDPGVRTVVAISTSPGAAGQNPLAVVGALSPRPFLALGCDGDPLTRPERVQELYDAARQPKELAILECDAHGNGIFGTGAADQVVERVMAWFERYVKPER